MTSKYKSPPNAVPATKPKKVTYKGSPQGKSPWKGKKKP